MKHLLQSSDLSCVYTEAKSPIEAFIKTKPSGRRSGLHIGVRSTVVHISLTCSYPVFKTSQKASWELKSPKMMPSETRQWCNVSLFVFLEHQTTARQ